MFNNIEFKQISLQKKVIKIINKKIKFIFIEIKLLNKIKLNKKKNFI